MKIGLVITTYNRPEELRQCLESLRQCELPKNLLLVIVDDHSDEFETVELGGQFQLDGQAIFVRNDKNSGIKESVKRGCTFCWASGCDLIINLDGDAIVKPDFFTRLIDLHNRFPESIVSGFNTTVQNRNPVISEHEDYILKKYVSGINMCFTKTQYERWLSPALRKEGNWDFNTSLSCVADNIPVVVCKPSVVQHIGINSTMGHTEEPDVAHDFARLHLPMVTLFGIAYNDPQGMNRAAEISTRDIRFGAKVILTDKLFEGRVGYSEFCIKKLTNYFDTHFVLKIEPDGYVQNWRSWSDEFLNYDYIGATWGYKDNMNVGNGGFSLRSKKLQDILSTDTRITPYHPEDHVICRVHRKYLQQVHGIKFAPEEIANKFSIEAFGVPPQFVDGVKYSGQFGFHGYVVQGLPYPPVPKPKPTVHAKPVPARRRFR
jgi:glycosyltransferase involved in cell wall biosynthesis